MNSLVSVIIPAHNAERFITKALDSLLQQTHTNWEACIALDNCTDRTHEKIQQHPTFPKCRIVHCSHGKPAGARNQAIAVASGNYLAFLDADDWWLPQKLETCLRHLTSSPSVDLMWHNETHVFESGDLDKSVLYTPLSHYYPDMLLVGNPISTSAVVIRNESDESGRSKLHFCEDQRFYGTEDFLLWSELARQGKRFLHIQDNLGFYLIRQGSVSSQALTHSRNTANVLDHFRNHDPNLNLAIRLKLALRAQKIRFYAAKAAFTF